MSKATKRTTGGKATKGAPTGAKSRHRTKAAPQEQAATPAEEPAGPLPHPAPPVGDTTAPDPAGPKTEPMKPTTSAPATDAEAASKVAKPRKSNRQKKTRGLSKKDRLVELLRREDGATIEELTAAFGWQAHTVRGAISIAAKQLGVTAERVEKGQYRLPPA